MYLLVLKCPGLKVDFPSPDLKYIHLRANKEEKKKRSAARRSRSQRSTRVPLGRSRVGAFREETPEGPVEVRASEGPGRLWPGRSKGPVSRRGCLGPRPTSAAPTLGSGSPGLPAAARSGLLERLEVASRCRPPRAPPASHSLGPVVTAGRRHLEPVKSASSSRPASVFPHPQALRAQASFECIN